MSHSPSPRLNSPLSATPGRFGNEAREFNSSMTDSNMRNRFSGPRVGEIEPTPGDASPTSTTLSNQSRSVFIRPNIPISASSALVANFDAPRGKIHIRADPALVTCFDPADKELYDLWAPKR